MLRHPVTRILAILILVTATAFFAVRNRPASELTVASWAGAYGHAQMSAQITPFARRSGANARIALYDGGTDELAQMVKSGQYKWDVIDMELPDAVAACRAGLLEPMAKQPPAKNGTPDHADFAPGALGKCWVGEVIYSRVIGYLPGHFATAPHTLADFFDITRYPGPRALPDSPKDTMEMALLADGVPARDVYAQLATPAGRARALRKLDTLKGSLVFAANGETPLQMLQAGRAAFATLLNGDVYDSAQNGSNVGVVWDGQIYGFDVLVIPRGTPKAKLAADYIRYAAGTEALTALSAWLPYGPARQSAMGHVGLNPDTKESLAPYRPTVAGRMDHALARNESWWAEHGADMEAAWQAWRAQR